MALAYRDMSKPYTEEELQQFDTYFKTIPTYNPENGGSVSVERMKDVVDGIGFERNTQQVDGYAEYWNTHFGCVPFKEFVKVAKTIHRHDKVFQTCVEICDKDGDGIITEEEFVGVLKMVRNQDAKLAELSVSFEDFVKEADINRDGQVSVDECSKWLGSKLNCTFDPVEQ